MSNSESGGQGAERSTALVLGASVAGLWAARVLADHFERVLVVERDVLPDGTQPRHGVPQARQYHILLQRGLEIMRTLFPGLEEDLVAAGAVPLDITQDVLLRSRGQWLRRFPSGVRLLGCSRLLLEAHLRRRLRQLPQVTFVQGTQVTGLVADGGGRRVTGVTVETVGGEETSLGLGKSQGRAVAGETGTGETGTGETGAGETGAGEKGSAAPRATGGATLCGALIVDALGRRSPTPQWLQALGYAPPQEEVIDSFLGYVTRRYRPLPGQTLRALLITATPPDNPRGGLVFPEEEGVWVVMMAGANKDYPPTDEEGFDAFARSLGPEFYAAVEAAEPISKPLGYRGTQSRWLHYEKLERWPQRLVVLGDAFCGFNPIYGQGMTVAALSAVALGDELARARSEGEAGLDRVAQRTLRACAKETAGAWLLATGADLEWPETVGGEGGNGPADRFARWYLDKLLDALGRDEKVRLAFNEVNQLMKPATSLFAPNIMLRVLTKGN
jgi:2-polyprenyl-6-methoxyphenol hydroxylase-like FAD-dependent oxidoreductase